MATYIPVRTSTERYWRGWPTPCVKAKSAQSDVAKSRSRRFGSLAAAVWSWSILGHIGAKVLLLAVVVGVAAQIGDLVESLFKRGVGIKDSGSLFPGPGGIMDRVDALFFAAPSMWLFLWSAGTRGIVP